ncbi:hypothetical protein [Halobacteriovorax sp. HLS]|uniref:hypothetical protein n=1 Tax=Halobacteriovorax sp. HLS TaxID=2234000 RepID=UPI000FDA5E30|nr:hypothetical protein [Halobacteriovorax sp. HLS]
MKRTITALLFLLSLSALGFPPGYATQVAKIKDDPKALFSGTVQEVKMTKTYTYVQVKNKNSSAWVATSPTKVLKGDKVEFLKGQEMKDFHSKALDRKFPSIYFTSYIKVLDRKISEKSAVKKGSVKKSKHTISDIFKNAKSLDKKNVVIRAKVVKYLPGIMKKNWLHVQDGTDYEGKFDLVITTNDVVKEGQIVELKATVALDKDFGHGYKYPILLENAKVIK